MPRLSPTLVALVALLMLGSPTLPAASLVGPGRPAPGVELPTGDGHSLSLASLKGRVVLVDFWASWCGPCAAAFPALDELYQEYRARGLEVVAVNLDEQRRDADRFLAGRPHAMTVLFDPQGRSAKAFGLEAMPTSFLLGRDGGIRFVHTGYSPGSLEAYRREIEQLLEEGQ
jgi:thiol-disulfide isomerase/thioredoxin